MKNNFKAQMGNALVTLFSFVVKFNPMWAYRFTNIEKTIYTKKTLPNHADKFLLGKDKEIKLIKKLLEKGVTITEIRSHLWSADTVLATLKDYKLANIFAGEFVDYISAKEQFNAVFTSQSKDAIRAACAQSQYTPSEEHILPIAANIYPLPNDINMTRPDYLGFLETIVKHHYSAFTEKLLNKFDANIQSLFLQLAMGCNKVAPEQVEWTLTHSGIVGAKEFIEQFYHLMPATAECAKRLSAHSLKLFDTWCKRQKAATLCSCCLNSWVKEENEQYLRLIEEKAFIYNDSDSAINLVRSTNKFVFQNALICILQQNAAEAFLLPYVDKENELYPKMVHQILNNSAKIKYLTENQVAQLSDKQRNLYWKNMALSGHMSAQQYSQLPEGELKSEIDKIMEDKAMIAWFQKNQQINEASLTEFGDKELSNRVQYWLANNGYLGWLVYYFSGSRTQETAKIAFNCNWKFTNNKATKTLSVEAFQKLVDDQREDMLKAYFHIYKSILPAQREYLLCSPLKHLAVGIGVY